LAEWGPYGMAMDFTDASIAIDDSTGVLDYNSQGTVSSTTGALLGPGSKLTYSAPSAKLTEQADGYLAFQAHNLILRSNDIANGAWVTTNSTKTSTAAGPFGSTAQLMTVTINANNALFLGSPVDSAAAGKVYYHAADLKAGTATWVTVEMWTGTGNLAAAVWVNLQTGALGSNVSTTNFTYLSSSITPISDGYYRVTIEAQATATATNMYWACRVTDGNGVFAFTAVSGLTYYVARPQSTRTPVASYDYVATTSAAVYDLPYVYSSGVKTGIMVEPAATNLVKGNTAASGYAGAQASPADATTTTPISSLTTMVSLTDNVNNVNHGLYGNAFNTSSATDYAISAIVKAGARNYAAIGIGVDASNYICAVFDIANGTFGQTSVGGTSGTIASSGTAYGIVPLANGCYRIWIAGKVTGAGTPIVFSANAATGNTFGLLGGPTYVGNGTVAIYTTAIQAETGTVATSPIITYGAAVTRAVDNISMATALFPLSATADTLFAQFTLYASMTADVLKLKPTSGIAEVVGFYQGTISMVPIVRSGGSVSFFENSALSPIAGVHKYAMAAETNNARAALDATLSTADTTSVTMPGTMDLLTIGIGNGAYGGSGMFLMTKAAYFPARKDDATLQTMTTA